MTRAASTLSRRMAAAAVGATLLTGGLTLAAAGPASADVVPGQDYVSGQFVNKSGLRCGGQERFPGSTEFLGVTLKQHVWVYYNCGDRSVRRKADIINDLDGDCYGIGPGEARVIATKNTVFPKKYRGSKTCR